MTDDSHRQIVQQIPHLRRYARALLRDAVAADDLVQDCLTRAMDRLHLWTPGTNMRSWLFTILHNQHVNQAKRRANRPDQVALEPAHDARHAAAPNQENGIAIRDMGAALAELPDDQRQVVLLAGLEGLAYREIAEIVDAPLGTVMSRLNRGRQKLRDLMDRDNTTSLRRVK